MAHPQTRGDLVIAKILNNYPPSRHTEALQSIIAARFEGEGMGAPLNMGELLNRLREKTATTLNVFTSKGYEQARTVALKKLYKLAEAKGINKEQVKQRLDQINQELQHINSTDLDSKERRGLELAYALARIYDYNSISLTPVTPTKIALKLLSRTRLSKREKPY